MIEIFFVDIVAWVAWVCLILGVWIVIAFAYDGFVLNYRSEGHKLKWWEKVILLPFLVVFQGIGL